MIETLKIIIPMAGWGTRMRPHTWSKPKPLVSVAGKTTFDHLMDMFQTVPNPENTEYIFIIGPFLGEQIREYVKKNYPGIKAHYVVQEVMQGQSHALRLGHDFLHGPTIMVFSDTLLETDFSFLAKEESDGVAWVKAVPDPRRFGVAEVKDGYIARLIEKPQTLENNLALVGCYYFKKGENLVSAISEQMDVRNLSLNGEYFLADAINIMLEKGAKMRTHSVDVWLDTGTIEATLDTNKYMLEHGHDNSNAAARRTGVTILPPVFIHPSACVEAAVIGPNVSIGPDCEVKSCVIRNTILDEGAVVTDSVLDSSFIGRQAMVAGHPTQVNMGDDSDIRL